MTGPRPGPHHAVPATPARAPGSARRTTSIDATRPDGLLGRVVADVRGQDVRTGADGAPEVMATLAVAVEIDPRAGTVTAVTGTDAGAGAVTGAGPPLGDLVGVDVRRGYGKRLAELLPEERERRSLLYSALEDLNGAALVAGYSVLRAGLIPPDRERAEQMARFQADVCVGWADGAPLVETLRRTGVSPVPLGPEAPAIDGPDPAGWHPMAELAPGTVRRRRRLDVQAAGDSLLAQSHFRDSHAGDDGETVMHEYLVHARIDGTAAPGALRLAAVDVEARVLPWQECPGAAASAQRLVGVAVEDLPGRVRRDLVGPTTCTHLNSTLRCLADLRALTPLLSA